jgi:hypothetical protein
MKLKYYVAGIISLIVMPVLAQDTADTLDNSINHDMQDLFIGGGFVLGNSATNATVLYGNSREFIIGAGIGYKFAKWNGIGIDIYYKSTDFFLKQDSNKVLPNNTLHNSEKVSFDNLGGLVFDRFYIGSFFLDGGFYFDWTFYTKHITWDNTKGAGATGSSVKTTDRQLNFVTPTNYGLTFRFGKITGVSLYFNYRLSNLFKAGTMPAQTQSGAVTASVNGTYSELPVYVLGLVFATH